MDAPLAVALDRLPRPSIQVLVNFGVFTGRDATRPEVERLVEALLERVPVATVTVQQRYEPSAELSLGLHEVLIEVFEDAAVESGHDFDVLRALIVADAERWVEGCREHPEGAMTLAERLGTATLDLTADPRLPS
jgi:hypothetical protein